MGNLNSGLDVNEYSTVKRNLENLQYDFKRFKDVESLGNFQTKEIML